MSDATDRYQLLLELSAAQALAVEALDAGGTHGEAAAAAGVDRTTVSRWAGWHPSFKAELNRRRLERAERNRRELDELTGRALDVVHEAISNGDTAVAIQWLKLRGLASHIASRVGPTDPRGIVAEVRACLPRPGDALLLSIDQPTLSAAVDHIYDGLEPHP